MKADFVQLSDMLVIPEMSLPAKALAVCRMVSPLLISYLLSVYFHFNKLAVLPLAIFFYFQFRDFIFLPMIFFRITLRKHPHGLVINGKLMRFDDMLFLSLREKDAYRVIRLEAKRSNILFSNEKVLKTKCKNFDEALAVCQQLRNFIHPDLRINHIKAGYARDENAGDGNGRKSDEVEVWDFL